VVDRTEPLVGPPCEVHLTFWVTVREVFVEPLLLPIGEMPGPGHQGSTDPVERVVVQPAPTQGVLLDPAADLVECVRGDHEALTALIEPLMIAFLGGIVGSMIISLYMPIFKVFELIG